MKILLFLGMLPVMSLPLLALEIDKQPGYLKAEFIDVPHSYLQCHSVSAVETPDGLAAAWFAGTKEGNPDVGIWFSRYADGKWTPCVEIANGAETENPRRNALNPVLFQVPQGPLTLFYKTGNWWAYIKRSTDGGLNWSTPERMYNGFVGPVKNKPVLLDDGSILSPASLEKPGTKWQVHFERSTNGGKSWSFIGPIPAEDGIQAIQPSILLHGGGKLQALGRTRQGFVFETWSEDNGETWTPIRLTAIPNPNSGTDAVTLRDGRHLLVYNHSTNKKKNSDKDSGYRSPLNVAVSTDGKEWKGALVLENEPEREFSYPAVIQTTDGLVHIFYTYRRENIKHVIVDPAKLRLRDMDDGQWPLQ